MKEQRAMIKEPDTMKSRENYKAKVKGGRMWQQSRGHRAKPTSTSFPGLGSNKIPEQGLAGCSFWL